MQPHRALFAVTHRNESRTGRGKSRAHKTLILRGKSAGFLSDIILIPFKARAFLDLSDRKAKGEQVDSDDIKKHRNDVFRLVQLLPTTGELVLPDAIKEDLRRFIEAVKSVSADPKSFGVPLTKDEGMEILNRFYALSRQEGAQRPEDQDG